MNIALVGNQNSGKTTLFNALTGSNQKVGNWPGVTIDRKEGNLKGTKHTIVDLPGIYSLSPYTSEEEISRKYAFDEKPDLIINIVDATSIERSLYLTTQLLELDCPVIVALNMSDILEKKGLKIDVDQLSKELGATIVEISALKNTGVKHMIELIDKHQYITNSHQHIFSERIEEAINQILPTSRTVHSRFVAVKVLENDKLFSQYQTETSKSLAAEIEKYYGLDMEQLFAAQRYDYIVKVYEKSVIKVPVKETITDKLDKVFLNKWAALPIFAVIMALIYFLAVGVVGTATVDFMDSTIGQFGEIVGNWLTNIGASEWAVSLVVDGIIAGVGAVLNFIPQLIILFLCICLLESSGYMSRIAFLLDKIFVRFGLSGKSLIPFIVGSGCSVPGIMAARTIESEQEKRITIMVTPFIPCSAKLPIIALFAGAFFPNSAGMVSFSLYVFAIVVIILSSLILNKIFKKDGQTAFISELPEYKFPNLNYVVKDVTEKTGAFIKRAGTIILLCSVVVWFLLSFNFKFEYGMGVEGSMLASIGNLFSWIFYPMTGELSWAATVSALQGLVAKEQVVSSMNIIAGLSEDSGDVVALFNSPAFAFFNPASAYAFCVFNLFSAPCFGAIGATRRELGSTKRMLQTVGFQTALAWVLGCLVYGIGLLIMRL